MTEGQRVWFKSKKISGTLYNNGILIAKNQGDTVDVNIGITTLVIPANDLLPTEGQQDLNGTKINSTKKAA